MEDTHYFFSRMDNNKILFFDRDVVVQKYFKELVQIQNMSLQNAAIIVASKFKDIPSIKDNTDIVEHSPNVHLQK
ncbi:hypothetical protein [Heyndrickxia ginsengihumi]|uniref:hypothetical protein n=1 Tax=Heyndrickxia ginsengihumi TaxID=363870 RepID=UPI003D263564